MTLEQLLTITQLLNQVDVVSMRESEISKDWILYLGADKEIRVWTNGTQSWYLNCELHRADGPAEIYANGYQSWWLNGAPLSEAEHTAAVTLLEQETI